jgi:DNA topoisomerase I
VATDTAVPTAPAALPDPVASARSAGLRYVSDKRPGIRRERDGEGFIYRRPDGSAVTEEAELERIRKLAVPPAWTDVWICPFVNGHLQACGRDARGRKQYRYHTRWRQVRDDTKYSRTIAFAEALPEIRRRVEDDLSLKNLPRRKVLATVVRLLETTSIRIGNQEYARENGSFGLTTMRDRHVAVKGATVQFTFRGKGGKTHRIDVADRRLAAIVKRCRELPGYELFQYIDENGDQQVVDSADVNDYLREVSGQDFTAKDFRTWAGTLLAALALEECEAFDSQTQCKKNIVQAIERVSKRLGNTPAICRKSYVHPAVLDAYADGITLRSMTQQAERASNEARGGLRPDEAAVLRLLRHRVDREARTARKIA